MCQVAKTERGLQGPCSLQGRAVFLDCPRFIHLEFVALMVLRSLQGPWGAGWGHGPGSWRPWAGCMGALEKLDGVWFQKPSLESQRETGFLEGRVQTWPATCFGTACELRMVLYF